MPAVRDAIVAAYHTNMLGQGNLAYNVDTSDCPVDAYVSNLCTVKVGTVCVALCLSFHWFACAADKSYSIDLSHEMSLNHPLQRYMSANWWAALWGHAFYTSIMI